MFILAMVCSLYANGFGTLAVRGSGFWQVYLNCILSVI